MDNRVSIGIFVYNEERNIFNILEALSKQKTRTIDIDEIIFVSSGSTDNTDKIIRDFSKKNKRIKLIRQKNREGKASAINLFLDKAKNDIVIIGSGDIIPKENCIEELCLPFLTDKNLGLTGAYVIPTNDKKNLLEGIIHYWWWMHNKLPRFGEMIAYRKNLVPRIPERTIADDAYTEEIITCHGCGKKLVNSAIVENHGAESLKDLIRQRRRIYIAYKRLGKKMNSSIKSFSILRVLLLTYEYCLYKKSVKNIFYVIIGIFIEIYSRFLGMIDLCIKNKNPYIWDVIESTKKIKT